jgi:hypothetical protein
MDRTPVKPVEPKFSWSQMIVDMNRLGYGLADLSAKLGAGYHTFEQLRSGRMKDPRWSTGEKLRRFHMHEMQKQRNATAAREQRKRDKNARKRS